MKRLLYESLLCILALLTACTEKDKFDSANTPSGNFVLKVKVENSVASRTMIDETNHVLWTEGDQIGVFVEGSSTPIPFTYSNMSGDIANFTGEIPQGKLIAAYYPYNETAKLEGTSLSINLPSEYEYSENHTNGPMLGQPDGENSFYFKHLCGLLKVTIEDIPANAAKLVVGSTSWPDPALYGDFVIEDITVEEPVLTDNDFENQSVNYNFTSELTGPKTFYIPLPPTTYPLEVSLQDADNNFLWYKKATVTIPRGSIVELPTINTTKALAIITSHPNGYSFSDYKTYTTIDVAGIIKNFYLVDYVKINLLSNPNQRHAEYNIYGGAAYPDGKEKAFTQTLDVYPGKNIYTISWKGKDTSYNEIEGDTTFVINYEEVPIIAEAVDLGLSVKWASHNIGASTEEEYGGLYIWADATGTDLHREDTIYYNLEKHPENINSISGNSVYDIAAAKWKGNWRLPTENELKELLDTTKVDRQIYTINGVTGMRFTSKLNGNSIFLPAAGYNYGYHDLRDRGTLGRYWSGKEYYDIFGHNYFNIFGLQFSIDLEQMEYQIDVGSHYYTFGYSVRPVYGELNE